MWEHGKDCPPVEFLDDRNILEKDLLGPMADSAGQRNTNARTIADLDHSDPIRPSHLNEAINYRMLDRHLWT